MFNINDYRDEIKRLYVILGKEAEERNKRYIESLFEVNRITYSEKEHLEKFNKNLGKAFK